MIWLQEHFLWIKALHVISVIAWMAGLLYLPRLFVYHVAATPGSEMDRTFQTMELRLYRFIMGPAMAGTLLFGLLLLISTGGGIFRAGWIYPKLALVGGLIYLHHRMGSWRRDFVNGQNRKSARFYRLINEVPTLAMIAIVILVVVQPF